MFSRFLAFHDCPWMEMVWKWYEMPRTADGRLRTMMEEGRDGEGARPGR